MGAVDAAAQAPNTHDAVPLADGYFWMLTTTKPLLKHLVEMTGHRDHTRLAVSVICAVREMSPGCEVRVLELIRLGNDTHVRPKAWSVGEVVQSIDDPQHMDVKIQLLSEFPVLVDCIRDRLESVQISDGPRGHELWLPVWLQDQVVACLELHQDQALAPEMLNVILGIFHVFRNYQSLLNYSERDALTGLFNRKTFDAEFARPWPVRPGSEQAQDVQPRENWLGIVDIDHFKQVNDRFGHPYGDEVLILVANLLRTSFRAQDQIFRFGGEEFVILLRAVTQHYAGYIFDRFRAAVEEHDFPQVGRVTVSVGFVCARDASSVEILGHADQALYYAKQHGRNQVGDFQDLVARGELEATVKTNDFVDMF